MREPNGRFGSGNKFSKGRPRRSVEIDYLAALSEEIPVSVFRDICKRAATDAANGDSKAREWISRHLIGDPEKIGQLKGLFEVAVTAMKDESLDASLLKKILDAKLERSLLDSLIDLDFD
ncbi:hypothetical protein [Rosistilla oblonga]|uniref:hypothetical protein n=1 Tax=Rosistilla oblonga TaxID=2527990 RepID=UPI003A974C89